MTTAPPVAATPSDAPSDTDYPFRVYEPHKAGLPKLGPYSRELWQRRQFAAEMSRASMRAANTRTVFGQIWLVLNPLLLAAVYYLLVNVLTGRRQGWDYFAHLTAGLFTFYFISGSMSAGAGSIVGGGKLLLNTAFPRLLMPLSAVRTAFFRYLPTLPVFFFFLLLAVNTPVSIPSRAPTQTDAQFAKAVSSAVVHHAALTWRTALAVVFIVMILVFASGLAAVFATVQVYFRDTSSFLPYFVRIWLYLSPVLFYADQMQKFKPYVYLNPLYSLLGGFTDLAVLSKIPPAVVWEQALFWTIITPIVGFWYLMSRERDFAVRI